MTASPSKGSGNLPREITGSLMRLRTRSPFFSVLALHARWVPDATIETACTDGRDVRFSPRFFAGLEPQERDFVICHEVGHMALEHVARRKGRDPMIWNVACDVVVNGMCEAAGLVPLKGCIRDRSLEHLRSEDVYARIKKLGSGRKAKLGKVLGSALRDLGDPAVSASGDPGDKEEADAAQSAWWRAAMRKAMVVERQMGHGSQALGALREVAAVMAPQLDWRVLLWHHLVQAPSDFQGYDRRFIQRGLYLDTLEGDRLDVRVCIDTSGSIGAPELATFVAELLGILRAHPHVDCALYYADANLYGPYPVTPDDPLPAPQGGGGTDFVPFFRAVANDDDRINPSHTPPVLVYLTDGFGRFPSEPPPNPVLWVVPDGGKPDFPWGDVARLSPEAT